MKMDSVKDTIRQYQADAAAGMTHPLTCGNDSSHKPLVPVIVKGQVELKCEDCDYHQSNIPPFVWGWKEIRDKACSRF